MPREFESYTERVERERNEASESLTRVTAEKDEEIARLRTEVESLRMSATMACENPCGDCAGCRYAADVYATTEADKG